MGINGTFLYAFRLDPDRRLSNGRGKSQYDERTSRSDFIHNGTLSLVKNIGKYQVSWRLFPPSISYLTSGSGHLLQRACMHGEGTDNLRNQRHPPIIRHKRYVLLFKEPYNNRVHHCNHQYILYASFHNGE